MKSGPNYPSADNGGGDAISENVIFALMMASAFALLVLGLLFSALLGVPIATAMRASFMDLAIGVIATLPLSLMLWLLLRSRAAPIVRFRESQLSFIEDIGVTMTPARILMIGVAAGLSEEILFRGLLQGLIDRHAPTYLAILIPNILFGALHAHTRAYAVAAGVLGVYMGALYWWTGSLWTPIIAHGLYDMIALDIARRELARRAR